MDELTAIDMLREVLLGKQRTPLPQNSVQRVKTLQKAALTNAPPSAAEPTQASQAPAAAPIAASKQSPLTPAGTPSNNDANYSSNDEDEPGPLSRGYKSSDDEGQDKDNWNMSNSNVATLPHIQ